MEGLRSGLGFPGLLAIQAGVPPLILLDESIAKVANRVDDPVLIVVGLFGPIPRGEQKPELGNL